MPPKGVPRTVRLLSAELRKLRRPLTIWTAVTVIVLLGLFAWGSAKQVRDELRFFVGNEPVPTCQEIGLQPGPACDRQLAEIRRTIGREAARQRAGVRSSVEILTPLGAGRMAAGMMASLIGAVVLFLFAGGHVGQEWSGRTMKQVLVQEGRRWRILAGKAVSLWIAGMGVILIAWLALAALMPILSAAYPTHVHVSAGSALAGSLEDVARAALVVAAFAAIGVLSAVVTRNTLGAFFLGFAFVLASLIVAGFKRVARLTLAYWVSGWMRFDRQPIAVQTNIWRNDFSPLSFPHVSAGLLGLVAFSVLCLLLAWMRFERSDVKV
jgi:ABC-type transport system involved in multi-copper enzyme maturation permease subunit